MNWQRLDRETTGKVIESVKSAADPGLFSPVTSEVQRAWLSFYDRFSLYRITNYASLPSFTFQFLGDGTFFHYLDGTEDPVHTANDKGALILRPDTVLDYLAFYFTHVQEDDSGGITLIKNPQDMPLLGSLDDVGAQAVIRGHRPAEIIPAADGFHVKTDLYDDGLVLRADVGVSATGRVSIRDRKMVVNAVARAAETENLVV